jgi:hypothetical protein
MCEGGIVECRSICRTRLRAMRRWIMSKADLLSIIQTHQGSGKGQDETNAYCSSVNFIC